MNYKIRNCIQANKIQEVIGCEESVNNLLCDGWSLLKIAHDGKQFVYVLGTSYIDRDID